MAGFHSERCARHMVSRLGRHCICGADTFDSLGMAPSPASFKQAPDVTHNIQFTHQLEGMVDRDSMTLHVRCSKCGEFWVSNSTVWMSAPSSMMALCPGKKETSS